MNEDGRRYSQTDPIGLRPMSEFRLPVLIREDAVDLPDDLESANASFDSAANASYADTHHVASPRSRQKRKQQSSPEATTKPRMSVSFNHNLTVIQERGTSNSRVQPGRNDSVPSDDVFPAAVDACGADEAGPDEVDDDDEGEDEQLWSTEQESPRKYSRWSVDYLRRQFKAVYIEDLYELYWIRIQRILLLKLLFFLVGQNAIYIILYNILSTNQPHTTRQSVIYTNVLISTFILLHIGAIVLVFMRAVYSKLYLYIGLVIWLTCNVTLYVKLPFTDTRDHILPMDNVPSVFYVIFVTHTMLPFSRKVSLSLGAITGAVDLVVMGTLTTIDDTTRFLQLAANVLIYTCASITGFYHKHLTDIAHRHTFLDTRNFLENNIKYCKQKQQQNDLRQTLLLKVIPQHLVEAMLQALRLMFQSLDVDVIQRFSKKKRLSFHVKPNDTLGHVTGKQQHRRRSSTSPAIGQHLPIDNLIELHPNVSILFADIVSFTPLTSDLEPSELVRTLNELFGRFDELAKANKCVRIKMLGDCYYCVSGMPEPVQDHAKNCVRMGLRMISVIREIRRETGIQSLDMRIGVHTGEVFSAVLGLRKWQYDIWSEDVTIANHMEAGGSPGKVHVTEATVAALGPEFEFEEGDVYDNKIQTFFIKETEKDVSELSDQTVTRPVGRTPSNASDRGRKDALMMTRKLSVYVESFGADTPFESLFEYMIERDLPAASEVNQRLMVAFKLDERSARSARRGSLFQGMLDAGRNLVQWNTTNISFDEEPHQRNVTSQPDESFKALTLQFINQNYEMFYANKRDSTYKFYIYCVLIIFVIITFVQFLALARNAALYTSVVIGFLVYTPMLILTTGLKNVHSQCQSGCRSWLLDTSELLITKWFWKSLLFIVSALTMFTAVIIPVLDCEWHKPEDGHVDDGGEQPLDNITDISDREILTQCLYAPYYIFSCMAALVSCSVFLRSSHLLKLTLMSIGVVGFNIILHLVFNDLFQIYDNHINYTFLPAGVRGSINIIVIFLTLVVLDRQIEQNLRLDFLCRMKLTEDKDELSRKELYNERLLANILPQHVADHFMQQNVSVKTELYYQHCQNACVMFAALPDFASQCAAHDISGISYLKELNKIISMFDQLSLTKKFRGVEKMKVIGTTYMAATGLTDTDSTEDEESVENVVLMTKFAWAMVTALKEHTELLPFQQQLRIGINDGAVVAGVVGAGKPQYDIWGDAVNVASRMESHGIIGRITVPDSTKALLERENIICGNKRVEYVKGKGNMALYTVRDTPRIRPRPSIAIDPENVNFNDVCT